MAKRKRPPLKAPKPAPKMKATKPLKVYGLDEFIIWSLPEEESLDVPPNMDPEDEMDDDEELPAQQWVIDALGYDPNDDYDYSDDGGYGDGLRKHYEENQL